MSDTTQAVFDAALALPAQSRAQLAEMLWASLADQEAEIEVSDDVRCAWFEEANRRMKQIESGEAELFDGQEVMDRFR